MYKHFVSGAERGGRACEAAFWTEKWSGSDLPQQFKNTEHSREWREIKRRVRPGSLILEAGCGLGQWVLFLERQGYKTTGLDISLETIKRLQQAFPANNWQYGDVRSLPFSSHSFEAVLSWGVIEHFEEGPQQVLEEFRRVLVPGGLLFVTVPYLCWRRRLQLRGKADNLDDFSEADSRAFYQYVLSASELESCVESAGLEVQSTVPVATLDGARRILGIQPGERGSLAGRICARLIDGVLPGRALGVMVLCVARVPA